MTRGIGRRYRRQDRDARLCARRTSSRTLPLCIASRDTTTRRIIRGVEFFLDFARPLIPDPQLAVAEDGNAVRTQKLLDLGGQTEVGIDPPVTYKNPRHGIRAYPLAAGRESKKRNRVYPAQPILYHRNTLLFPSNRSWAGLFPGAQKMALLTSASAGSPRSGSDSKSTGESSVPSYRVITG